MNLLIIGAPGAGKGTMSENIIKDYELVHVSTGDMLRAAVKNETAVGLNTNGTHKTTTGNYTSTATTIAGEIAALDAQTKTNTDAISALQNNSVTNIKVNEKTGTVTNHVAAVTIDGGDVKLTGYTQDTTTYNKKQT